MSWNRSLFERWPNLTASIFSPLLTQTHSHQDLDADTPPDLCLSVSPMPSMLLNPNVNPHQNPPVSCHSSLLPPHGSDFFTCPLRHCTLHFPSAPLAVSSESPLLDALLLDNFTALKRPKAQPMDINLSSSLYTHSFAESLQFHGF